MKITKPGNIDRPWVGTCSLCGAEVEVPAKDVGYIECVACPTEQCCRRIYLTVKKDGEDQCKQGS